MAYTGVHDAPTPFVESAQGVLCRSDSMDMENDPRFGEDNLLDKRLAAFGSLAVVSGFMVDTCMGQVYDMDHNMQILVNPTAMDIVLFISFVLNAVVLYANVMAMYVGVAQIYHTIRLMTAGPTGFEQAKLYYLNPNLCFYRHVAIRLMLNGLWLFMIGGGLRMWVKFSKDATGGGPRWVEKTPEEPPSDPLTQPNFEGLTFIGLTMCVWFIFMGVSLFYMHIKHVAVFRERYNKMNEGVEPFLSTVAMVSARGRGTAYPDV
jgi:hypothetical protein